MLTAIHPKLPMRNKAVTKDFYVNKLGFQDIGVADFEGYLLLEKDNIELHFFEFKDLIPEENYGQVYIRTNNIETLYKTFIEKKRFDAYLGAFRTQTVGANRIFDYRPRP